MLIVLLTYTEPLDRIDALMRAHVAFLKRHYASGHFLASGRRVPRTGGVILAAGIDRDALERLMGEDPFCREGAARFEIVEFTPSMTAPALAAFKRR